MAGSLSAYPSILKRVIPSLLAVSFLFALFSCQDQEEIFAEIAALKRDMEDGLMDEAMLEKVNFTLRMEALKSEGEDYLLSTEDEIKIRTGHTLVSINNFASRADFRRAEKIARLWFENGFDTNMDKTMDRDPLDPYPLEVKYAEEVYEVFDLYPEAVPEPEGGMKEFLERVSQTLRYPAYERNAGIQGKVYVLVKVGPNGELVDVAVIKGLSPSLDAAAINAVRKAGTWIPGEVDGKRVSGSIRIPIVFKLPY